MQIQQIEIDFAVHDCPWCHCLFAIPNEVDEQLRKTYETYYCPSGHKCAYPGPKKKATTKKKPKK